MKELCQEGSDYENGNMTLVQKWPAILHLQIGLRKFSIFGKKPLFGREIRLLKYRMWVESRMGWCGNQRMPFPYSYLMTRIFGKRISMGDDLVFQHSQHPRFSSQVTSSVIGIRSLSRFSYNLSLRRINHSHYRSRGIYSRTRNNPYQTLRI